mmetsp:Transcript_17300/g.39061  ORF Transcript_17300/g.39061 Transcript_17300/m.39061 type:complete len:212 (+) Transcript_17300:222-857(+)
MQLVGQQGAGKRRDGEGQDQKDHLGVVGGVVLVRVIEDIQRERCRKREADGLQLKGRVQRHRQHRGEQLQQHFAHQALCLPNRAVDLVGLHEICDVRLHGLAAALNDICPAAHAQREAQADGNEHGHKRWHKIGIWREVIPMHLTGSDAILRPEPVDHQVLAEARSKLGQENVGPNHNCQPRALPQGQANHEGGRPDRQQRMGVVGRLLLS